MRQQEKTLEHPPRDRQAGQTVAIPDDAGLAALVEASRVRIERGSKSFATAARLFDADTRASAYMLYAWCRHCDDVIDGQEFGYQTSDTAASSAGAQARLVKLRAETLTALEGDLVAGPDQDVFAALATVVARHDIPNRHPLELIDGFAMDVEGRTYATLSDTLDYSYHVAGVVGVMMAMIMGVRDRATLNRASDLGIAFQLTNIARDVVPDAEVGRVYLPQDWLNAAGVSASPDNPAAIVDPAHRDKVYAVAERLLDTADLYYQSAEYGIPHLPARAAWAIAAARNVYREIGRVIRARGPRAWDSRAYVGRGGKLQGVALGGLQAATARFKPLMNGRGDAATRAGLWTHPDLGDV